MDREKISDAIREALFPSNIYCILCGSLIDKSRPYALCDRCARQIHWIVGRTCAKCGKALPDTYHGGPGKNGGSLCYDCMWDEHVFTRGWSCMTYGLHERELMMDMKYNGKGFIAAKMGDVLYDRMEELIKTASDKNIILFDMIIPVPISRRRAVERGYNQSELMARQFVKRWRSSAGRPPEVDAGLLIRQRDTKLLRSLGPAERRLALRGAFGVKSGSKSKVSGKTVLLIDDIYTTGATADECSRALIECGAGEVYLLTLCSGSNRTPCI